MGGAIGGLRMARILVVDDEKEVVYIIKFVLEKAGHTVLTANNGAEALAVLGVEPSDPNAVIPDLVFLDVMMPIMDGHTASIRMLADSRTSKLPIIIETAYGDMLHLFEGAPNIAGYLQKPFNPRQIKEQVERPSPSPRPEMRVLSWPRQTASPLRPRGGDRRQIPEVVWLHRSRPSQASTHRNGPVRRRPKAAKATFEDAPRDPGKAAPRRFGTVSLSLKDYETARECFPWSKKNPKSAYVWWNQQGGFALEREDDLANDLTMAAEADKRDLRVWHRLDKYGPKASAQASGKIHKSIGTEELTPQPQRIVYAGRSSSIRGIARVHPKVDLLMGYSLKEDIQKNDTRGFTYFDVLEQTPSLGVRVRPMKRLDLEAEYGQAYFSDVESLGVGRQNFVRARVAGEWRHPWATFRAKGVRAPYYLRGGFNSTYFKVLRELSASGEIEKAGLGITWLLKGGHTGYSDRTNLVTWGSPAPRSTATISCAPGSPRAMTTTPAPATRRSRFAGYDGGGSPTGIARGLLPARPGLRTTTTTATSSRSLRRGHLLDPFARSSLEYHGEAADYRFPSRDAAPLTGPSTGALLAQDGGGRLVGALAWEHGWRATPAGLRRGGFLAETEHHRTEHFSTQLGAREPSACATNPGP